MNPDLRPVRTVLTALRGRLRRVRLLRALTWIVGATSAAVLVSFTLDRLLDLPLPVRGIHLVVALGALVGLGIWACLPLRARLDDTDLAQALEDVVPALGDRVASALDFERRLGDPHETESRDMMRIVVLQAAAAIQRVRPAALVDTRPLRRLAAAAGAVLLALVVVGIGRPADFGLWVRRGILLEDVEWPRRTHMQVVDFPDDGMLVVTHGQDLQISAIAEGTVPREVLLHYEALEYPEGADPRDADVEPQMTESDVRRMFAIEDETGATGRFAFQFRSVSTSFRFWVTGGDDDDRAPIYLVRAMIPPRVASITADVTYPQHSGLPPAVVRETNFEVLRGSRVELSLVTNMPLASARLVPEGGTPEPLVVKGDGNDTLSIGLDIRDDARFHISLTAATGQTNREGDDRFLIRALVDRAPDIRVLFPLGRLYRTPNGFVPVKAFVLDDFGATEADLDTAMGDQVATTRLWTAPAEGGAVKRADLYHPVELAGLRGAEATPLRAGDLVRMTLRARDNADQESVAPETTIEILAPEDLERRLAQRQVGLRDQLTQLRSHHRRTREELQRLRAGLADHAVNPEDHDTGRDLQVEQGRITGEIGQFVRGIERVFDAYVMNRLGGIPAIDRILPLYQAALAVPTDDSESVFPRSLYAEIIEGMRAKRIYDPEIIGTLLQIMDRADVCEREASPAVYQALRTWADGSVDAELLAEAERRSDELATHLRELDRLMDRWEAMSEIIELTRQIRNREDTIAAPVDESLGGDTERR